MMGVTLFPMLAVAVATGFQINTERDGSVSVFCRESFALTRADYEKIGQIRGVKTLTLYNKCSLTDETLALLTGLDQVEKVGIDGARFTDDGMKHMAGWTNLRQLTFFHILNKDKFTGAGVAHLAGLPRLESFGCGGSSFTDAGMAAVARLPRLTELRVWHTLVTDDGVACLTNTTLRRLRLAPQFLPRITEAVLPHIAAIQSLESLSLGEMKLTWDGGLKHLKSLPKLKELELDLVVISDADLARLKTEMPDVKISVKPPDEKQRGQIERNWDKK